jgi:cytochrome c-type biogenesis protein CcmH/NrfG
MISALLLCGAAAVVLAPLWQRKASPLGPAEVAMKAPHLAPTYQSAIADLAHVRLRLLQTDSLDDKAKAAIDTLTLALVSGSDK